MEQGLWIAVLALVTALIGACAGVVKLILSVLLRIIDKQEATILLERQRADEAGRQSARNFELALEQLEQVRILLQSGGSR